MRWVQSLDTTATAVVLGAFIALMSWCMPDTVFSQNAQLDGHGKRGRWVCTMDESRDVLTTCERPGGYAWPQGMSE